jgi:hypothetical protein
MGFVTANGLDAIEAIIIMPRMGPWHADLVVDAVDASKLTGDVSIDVASGGLKLSGSVRRGGVFAETPTIRVVAGKGGLGKEAAAKAYENPTFRNILSDLLSAAGESLSDTSAQGTLSAKLTNWATIKRPAGECISALVTKGAPADTVWRMLEDGKLFVGVDSFPEVKIDFQVMKSSPQEGRLEIGTDSPTVLPGKTFDGRKVSYVEHRIASGKIRSAVWFED